MSKHVKKTILRAGVVLTILGSGTVVLTGISMLHPVFTLGISGLGVLLLMVWCVIHDYEGHE